MALKAAKELLKNLQSDLEFKAKLKGAADKSAWHQLAKAAGFDCTLEEYKQAVEEMTASREKGELTEDQLKNVAGGYSSSAGEYDWNDKLEIGIGANRQ